MRNGTRTATISACASLLLASATVLTAAPTTTAKNRSKQTDTVITANRLEYEYSQSMIFFEENVKVEDTQFTMTSDRMTVILDSTNDVKQVKAVGRVNLKNVIPEEKIDREARCQEAVYFKAENKIVMTGDVSLRNGKDNLWGKTITIWLNEQRMVCEPSRLSLSPKSAHPNASR